MPGTGMFGAIPVQVRFFLRLHRPERHLHRGEMARLPDNQRLRQVHLLAFCAIARALGAHLLAISCDSTEALELFWRGRTPAECIDGLRKRWARLSHQWSGFSQKLRAKRNFGPLWSGSSWMCLLLRKNFIIYPYPFGSYHTASSKGANHVPILPYFFRHQGLAGFGGPGAGAEEPPGGATGAMSNPIIVSDLIKTGRFDDHLPALFAQGKSDVDVAWGVTDELVASAGGFSAGVAGDPRQ